MEYPSIYVEEADSTLFDICQEEELLQVEETKNVLMTKKFLERIMKTEKEIENSIKKASK